MEAHLTDFICQATGASQARILDTVQSLWSGYGSLLRIGLVGADGPTAILKRICPPRRAAHPRGWHSPRSHQRKLRSYRVESSWYMDQAANCSPKARIPNCMGCSSTADEQLILLEDLDTAGFPLRKSSLNEREIQACLEWLAWFHASFLGAAPTGLWEQGCYWHLATRPEEWAAMQDLELKAAAKAIDQKLLGARFRTLVHGDAKVANFCFAEEAGRVAAVDFQYVGGGIGMQDVVYFLGSCLDERACEKQEQKWLKVYFSALNKAVAELQPEADFAALELEWRALYPYAWTDFSRFLNGWMPGHWKINSYSQKLRQQTLTELKPTK